MFLMGTLDRRDAEAPISGCACPGGLNGPATHVSLRIGRTDWKGCVVMMTKHIALATIMSIVLSLAGGGAQAVLVNQWTFDEGSGTSAADSVGGKTGTLTNGPVWVNTNLAPVPSGTTDALKFDNTNDYVNVAGYKGITGTNPRSVSAWVKTGAKNRPIISWGKNTGTNKWVIRTDNSSGALRVEVNGGYQIGDVNVSDNTWHHVAVTWENDGSANVMDARLWVDGQLQGIGASLSKGVNTVSNANVRISQDFAGREFNGQIDEVRIYDNAIGGSEVRALAGLAPDLYAQAVVDDGAAAYWRLGEGTGSKAFNEGTLGSTADATYSGVAGADKGVGGLLFDSPNTAVRFDGTDGEVRIGDNDGINTGAAKTDKTFELVFRADDVSGRQVLFDQGGTTNGFNLYLQNDELYFGAWTGNTFFSADTASSAVDILADTTYHVAGTWDNGELMLYLQGLLVDSTTASFTSVAAHGDDGAIGGVHTNSRFHNGTAGDGLNFAGRIDEVALYNTVLSADQILAHSALVIPEPMTMLAVGLSITGLGGYIRKRRRA